MERDKYWDSLKFVLIFFVVYGHIIETKAPVDSINRALFNLIYAFHMPLFIFVSGRFSHINDKTKYIKGIVRLLETYIIFQAFWCFVPDLLYGNLSITNVFSFFVNPIWALWYLLSLIFWRLLIIIIPSTIIKNKPLIILMICFIISIAGGFIPIGGQFAIHRTLAFLPFFFLGYYSKGIHIKHYISRIPVTIPIITIVLAFLVSYYCLNTNITRILCCYTTYWESTESIVLQCITRLMFLVSAIFISVVVMRLVKEKQILANWGTRTMFIYIYHSFAFNALMILVARGIIPQNEFLMFFYAVVITFSLLFLSKIRLFTLFMNPFSNLLTKRQ